MSAAAWVKAQLAAGNLVEDGSGCVAKLEQAARELDADFALVATDDAWTVDTNTFAALAHKYTGSYPRI